MLWMKESLVNSTPLILLTNDDGIASPGLAAAAKALDGLGELLIVAPSVQQTSMGRSRSQACGNDGRLFKRNVSFKEQVWDGIAANASPALTVEHAILEIAPRPLSLVVSGINHGENVGSCVTVSGTIGAALEAADSGIKALAISLELAGTDYHSFDDTLDFEAAIHFTRLFADKALKSNFPADVDLLKIEVPLAATARTQWVITKQDRLAYYTPHFEARKDLFEGPNQLVHTPAKGQSSGPGTDAHALAQGWVSVTPLSLDLTSRVALDQVQAVLD